MSSLWIGMVVLTILAVAFFAWPYIRKSKSNDDADPKGQLNVLLMQNRLQELGKDKEEGLLSETDLSEAEKEMKLALVGEVDSQDQAITESSTNDSNSSRVFAGVAMGVSIAVTALVYWQANQVSEINQWNDAIAKLPELGKRVVVDADPSITPQDLETFSLGLRSRLIEEPNDPVGWLLLGRVFTSLNNIESAIQAFEKSLALDSERFGTLVSYGQALLLTNGEAQIIQAKRLLSKAVQMSPADTNALGLLAIAATQSNDTALAISSWQGLKKQLGPGDPLHSTIEEKLAQLQGTSPTLSGTGLEVTVNLSDSLLNKLPENGYLFVFAQNADSEMKMPAAVVRSQITEFPVKVYLGDEHAMVPNFTLSSLSNAKLVARISADQNVDIGEGELQGELVIPISENQRKTVAINIDRELP